MEKKIVFEAMLHWSFLLSFLRTPSFYWMKHKSFVDFFFIYNKISNVVKAEIMLTVITVFIPIANANLGKKDDVEESDNL